MINKKDDLERIDSLTRYIKINRLSQLLFQSEIYEITFKTFKKTFNLFLSPNELICNDYIHNLKKNMNIDIWGDGSCFEVLDYTHDFKIEFDSENTTFVDTDSVTDGVVYFYKE